MPMEIIKIGTNWKHLHIQKYIEALSSSIITINKKREREKKENIFISSIFLKKYYTHDCLERKSTTKSRKD